MVWEAWTDPKQVALWWGPNGFSTTIEQMDVRPGGVWKQVLHGPDGHGLSERERVPRGVAVQTACLHDERRQEGRQ